MQMRLASTKAIAETGCSCTACQTACTAAAEVECKQIHLCLYSVVLLSCAEPSHCSARAHCVLFIAQISQKQGTHKYLMETHPPFALQYAYIICKQNHTYTHRTIPGLWVLLAKTTEEKAQRLGNAEEDVPTNKHGDVDPNMIPTPADNDDTSG